MLRLAVLMIALSLSACAPPGDPLDHTPSTAISDPRVCACLARQTVVADSVFDTPCLATRDKHGCGWRVDCAVPQICQAGS